MAKKNKNLLKRQALVSVYRIQIKNNDLRTVMNTTKLNIDKMVVKTTI